LERIINAGGKWKGKLRRKLKKGDIISDIKKKKGEFRSGMA